MFNIVMSFGLISWHQVTVKKSDSSRLSKSPDLFIDCKDFRHIKREQIRANGGRNQWADIRGLPLLTPGFEWDSYKCIRLSLPVHRHCRRDDICRHTVSPDYRLRRGRCCCWCKTVNGSTHTPGLDCPVTQTCRLFLQSLPEIIQYLQSLEGASFLSQTPF